MKNYMMLSKSLLWIFAGTIFIATSSTVRAQTKNEKAKEEAFITVDDAELDVKPKLDFNRGEIELNPRVNFDPDFDIGGKNGGRVNPDFDFKDGRFSADLNGRYNQNINLGGKDGLKVNPNLKFRDGELTIDPKIDPNQLVNSLAKKAKQKLVDFAVDKLEADKFLSDLNSDLSKIAGDIGTFLGFKGSEPEAGDLGIPNLQEARIVLNEDLELNRFNDALGTQTGTNYAGRDELYQQYLRELSQEYSENSALSLEGQSKLKAKVDSANASAEQSLYIAEDSSNQDVSQNLLRNVSNQMGIQQQIDAMAISEMQDAKVDRSLALQIDSENLIESSKSNLRSKRLANGVNSAAQSSMFLVTIPGKSSSAP